MSPPLPVFRYPSSWVVPRNPLSHGMTEISLAWGDSVGLREAQPTGLHAMGRGLNMGAYAGWIHPRTDSARLLQLSSDFALWITVLDDALERLGPTLTARERRELADASADFFDRPQDCTHPLLSAYASGYLDLQVRALEMVPQPHRALWQARMHYELAACNRVSLTEEPLCSERWMDIGFYEQIRPFTPGVLPFMPLAEIADGCFLAPAVWEDPRLKELEETACVVFGMFNDVASLEKDETGGPVPNVVLMHQQQFSNTVGESVSAIAHRHNVLVGQMERCADALRRSHQDKHPETRSYVASVQHLTAGIANWHLHAPRYGELIRKRARLEPAAEAPSRSASEVS